MRRILTFVLLTSLASCYEDRLVDNDSIYKSEILDYTSELRKVVAEADVSKIEELESAIDFKAVNIYKLRTTESAIIVRLSRLTGFGDTDNLRAVLFVNQGKIIRSNIVSFKNRAANNDYDQIILSILDMKSPKQSYSGKVSFFGPLGNLLIFNEFENGNLSVNGIAKPKSKVKKGGRTNGCTAWYLITTYYQGGVVTGTSEVYLFTTCDCGEEATRAGGTNCAGQGGGGGGSLGSPNGPTLPANPQNNQTYEYTDSTGKYVKYQYDSQKSIWVIIDVILPPATIISEPENYPFLVDIVQPLDKQVVFGDDNLLYKYDAASGSWVGVLNSIDIWEDQINDKSLKPCMQTIVNDLKNLTLGSVGQIIQKFSGTVPGYNWEMKDGSLVGGQNAFTNQAYNKTTGTVTTTFDGSKFTNSTELSIARTILHESVHAYLVTYFMTDPLAASKSYPQLLQDYFQLQDANAAHHIEITRSFVNDIAIALQEFGISKGYNLNFQFYQDMAWAGLSATPAFQALSQSDQNRINDTIQIELFGKDSQGNTQFQKGKSAGC